MRISLCTNCLGRSDGVIPVEVGPEKGTQRDPYRDTIDLCGICKNALLKGDFATLAECNRTSTVIEVGEPLSDCPHIDWVEDGYRTRKCNQCGLRVSM